MFPSEKSARPHNTARMTATAVKGVCEKNAENPPRPRIAMPR